MSSGEVDIVNDLVPIRDSSESGNIKHKKISVLDFITAVSWVTWPLSGADDSRGGLGSDTYDPDTSTFWKKVSLDPHLWVVVGNGGVGPTPGWVFVYAGGEQVFADGEAVQVPEQYSNS